MGIFQKISSMFLPEIIFIFIRKVAIICMLNSKIDKVEFLSPVPIVLLDRVRMLIIRRYLAN